MGECSHCGAPVREFRVLMEAPNGKRVVAVAGAYDEEAAVRQGEAAFPDAWRAVETVLADR